MAFGIVEIILSAVLLILLTYLYVTRNFNFWKSRKIPGPKPLPFFGTIKDVIFGKMILGLKLKQLYEEYPNEPMVGIFLRSDPVLVINDMKLIKNVLIKDFKNFMDRIKDINEKHEPLLQHLFLLDSKRWRSLRTKLSPVFTSGKLKDMFYLLDECSEKLEKYLDNCGNEFIDMREIAAKFATDVIAVCAFGLEANALEDENSTFRKMGKRIHDFELKNFIRFHLRDFAPRFYDIVGKWLTDHVVNDFFINLTKDTIEYRKNNNINRHDFIDLLAALKYDDNKMDGIELTDSLLASQLFVFFLAGFETSSSTISNCLFELAINPDIQTKLREEIKEKLKETNGKITYDLVKDMKYLDKVFKETLRKYPPATFLMRMTSAPYTFTESNVTLPTGINVIIPIYAIQHDPKYFPNPKIFDPERFTNEAIEKRPAMAYLPFGDGPRNCIGVRFGIMQSKVGILKVLQNYTVDVCEKTDKDYTLHNRSFLLTPKNGIILKITKEK